MLTACSTGQGFTVLDSLVTNLHKRSLRSHFEISKNFLRSLQFTLNFKVHVNFPISENKTTIFSEFGYE